MAGDIPVMIGQQRFLQMVLESTWGTTPGTPSWIDVPVNDYNVRFKPKRRNGQARAGSFQRRYGANVSGHPTGNLVVPLYGYIPTNATVSLAQLMLEFGFLDQENKFPRSYSAQWEYAGHEDDKGQTGLRVNQISLAGSDSGIVLTLELIGQTSSNFTGTATPPSTRNKLVEFLFPDCVFSICPYSVSPILVALPISSFQWSCQRNLDVIYENSNTPIACPKTAWTETFSVTPVKTSSAYDVSRDALGMPEFIGQLVLKGLHNGTGTGGTSWMVNTVSFPRLSLIDSDEQGGTSAMMNPLTFDVLKPDTSANGSTMTWTQV